MNSLKYSVHLLMTVLKLSGKLNFPGPVYALALSFLNFENNIYFTKFKFYSTIKQQLFLVCEKIIFCAFIFILFFNL